MVVSIGSDRSGFEAKSKLIVFLREKGFDVRDCGVLENVVCDYPIYAEAVAKEISCGISRFGVLICGSGEGMAIAANKIKGIRCGIGYNDEVSVLLREHNDANVIAFGARFMKQEDIERRTLLFLSANFLGEWHKNRVDMINRLR